MTKVAFCIFCGLRGIHPTDFLPTCKGNSCWPQAPDLTRTHCPETCPTTYPGHFPKQSNRGGQCSAPHTFTASPQRENIALAVLRPRSSCGRSAGRLAQTLRMFEETSTAAGGTSPHTIASRMVTVMLVSFANASGRFRVRDADHTPWPASPGVWERGVAGGRGGGAC